MAFVLRFTTEARRVLAEMESNSSYAVKLTKVHRCLARIERDPRHPGLNTHRYQTVHGPNGEDVWEAYVENRTPSAWRVWYWYGPGRGTITILTIGPHP